MRRFERRSATRSGTGLDGLDPSDVAVRRDEPAPGTSILADIDAALSFTVGRELVSRSHVVGVIELLRALPVAEPCATRMGESLDELTTWIGGRRLVSGAEMADRLLDLRLTLMPVLGVPVRSTALTTV